MIYSISDLHLGHKNIIRYCDRPFSSVEEMDKFIIDSWNKVVTDEDEVYFLGDFCFGRPGKEVSQQYKNRLNGKIHLIRGNHDKYIDESIFETVQDDLFLNINNKVIYMCHYPDRNPKYFDLYLYGHVHNKYIHKDKYMCMCVEAINYEPFRIDNL